MIQFSTDRAWNAQIEAEQELLARMAKVIKEAMKHKQQPALYLFGRLIYAMRSVAEDFRNDGLLDGYSRNHPETHDDETDDELKIDEALGILRCGQGNLPRNWRLRKLYAISCPHATLNHQWSAKGVLFTEEQAKVVQELAECLDHSDVDLIEADVNSYKFLVGE
jgi:hypothetical protein